MKGYPWTDDERDMCYAIHVKEPTPPVQVKLRSARAVDPPGRGLNQTQEGDPDPELGAHLMPHRRFVASRNGFI